LSALSDLNVPFTAEVNESRIPWIEYERPYGVFGFKLLFIHNATGRSAMLAKFPAGITTTTHKHLVPVQAWVISGSWHYVEYDWIGTAGSYIYEPPGAEHTLEVLEAGMTLFMLEGPSISRGANGEIKEMVDSFTIRDDYKSALEAQGLEYPSHLIER
jgi:2,4'-dihydroxyacetophenone dioxygenase